VRKSGALEKQAIVKDRFGNPHAPGLPYAHGEYIRSSENARDGSVMDENPTPRLRLLLGAKQTFSAEKQTINF
jgi:hypothetical protein